MRERKAVTQEEMAKRYERQLEIRRRSYAKNAEARKAYARARYAKMMEALRKAENRAKK